MVEHEIENLVKLVILDDNCPIQNYNLDCNSSEVPSRNHSKFKVEESDMFNKINFMSIFVLVLVVLNGIEARRIKSKGNLRGVTTQFSNLSPREMMMLRKLMKIKQQSRHGRFQ